MILDQIRLRGSPASCAGLPPGGASAGKTLSDEVQCRAHHRLQPSLIFSIWKVCHGEFGTSVGHSQDFQEFSFQKMLRNISSHFFHVGGIHIWYLQYNIGDIWYIENKKKGLTLNRKCILFDSITRNLYHPSASSVMSVNLTVWLWPKACWQNGRILWLYSDCW